MLRRTDRVREAEQELLAIFRRTPDKREAHRAAAPVLEQLTRDPSFFTTVLERYLETPGALDKKNYPQPGLDIALNPYFGLVANCWIPLPGRETHVSTKSIHHHGPMLLTTATLFGPGYEHWMFTTPKAIDRGKGLFDMELLEAAAHPRHHVAFVDARIAHTPLFPKSLSVTLALWSSETPVTWRDRVKRLPVFKGREAQLRSLAARVGLKKKLELKMLENLDFFPSDEGFVVIPERKEFERGPVEDHVCSVFHVVQATGNERLAGTIRRAVDEHRVTAGRAKALELLEHLQRGKPIEGALSAGHTDLPHANFTRADIERALAALKARKAQKSAAGRGADAAPPFSAAGE